MCACNTIQALGVIKCGFSIYIFSLYGHSRAITINVSTHLFSLSLSSSPTVNDLRALWWGFILKFKNLCVLFKYLLSDVSMVWPDCICATSMCWQSDLTVAKKVLWSLPKHLCHFWKCPVATKMWDVLSKQKYVEISTKMLWWCLVQCYCSKNCNSYWFTWENLFIKFQKNIFTR